MAGTQEILTWGMVDGSSPTGSVLALGAGAFSPCPDMVSLYVCVSVC